jgi:hypothetical protein
MPNRNTGEEPVSLHVTYEVGEFREKHRASHRPTGYLNTGPDWRQQRREPTRLRRLRGKNRCIGSDVDRGRPPEAGDGVDEALGRVLLARLAAALRPRW